MVPSTVEVPHTTFPPLFEKMYVRKNEINDEN